MAGDDKDGLQSKAADLVRKVLTVGVGAAFLTEESVRTLVSEFKLPKELLTGVLESAGKTKNEFLQNLQREIMARIKDKLDPGALIQEVLQKNEFSITVKVNVTPKGKHHAAAPEKDEEKA